MKYSDLTQKLKDEIHGKVTEHENGSISVDGHVRWHSIGLTSIPIKFRHVTGNFWCFENKLTSLENAPDWVGLHFDCSYNQLASLEYAPRYIGGTAFCHDNQIDGIERAPAHIGGDFWCQCNRLTSLDGLGEVRGEIRCHHNQTIEKELLTEYWRKRAKKELAAEP